MSYIAYQSQMLLMFCFTAIVVVHTYQLKDGCKNWGVFAYLIGYDKVLIAAVILYCFLVVISGDRGPLVTIALLLAGGFCSSTGKKVGLAVFFVALILGSIAMTFLGSIRAFEGFANPLELLMLSYDRFKSGNFGVLSPMTLGLAGSVGSLHAAIEHVRENGFYYGKIHFVALLEIFPFIGSLFPSAFDLDPLEFSPAHIITKYGRSVYARNKIEVHETHGVGTTCLADLYLDFGVLGVVCGMFLWGWFVRRLDVSCYNNQCSSWGYVMYFVFLSQAIHIPRGSILPTFRGVLFCVSFVYFANLLRQFFSRSTRKIVCDAKIH